jgi:hypothetical protein
MMAVGSFFVWWGKEYYGLELIEETNEKPRIMIVLLLGAFLIVIGLESIFVALLPTRLHISVYSIIMALLAIACLVVSIVIFARMNEIDDMLSD